MSCWKISVYADKVTAQNALLAHEDAWDWDDDIVLSGREIAEDKPNDWVIEAWFQRRPSKADKARISALFATTKPDLFAEKLPDEDWVTLSQQGTEPITAGQFYVHTPEHAPSTQKGYRNFVIPASQAFGTGQHETTAGCLAMLSAMKQSGVVARNCIDVGTGTGLLAFAAAHLWPNAFGTASDIDDVCADVVAYNASQNGVALGAGRGALTMVIADGMAHPLLQARGPYDLLIANILAGPLIALAPDFAGAVSSGGDVLLAGLLSTQEHAVRTAYFRAGFRLRARGVNGDWSILWLRKRR